MQRTLIGTKVEAKAAKILDRVAKRKKQTRSAYCAAVLEDHVRNLNPQVPPNFSTRQEAIDYARSLPFDPTRTQKQLAVMKASKRKGAKTK